MKSKNIAGLIFLSVHAVLSVVLAIQLFMSNLLPSNYLLLALVVLVVLLILSFLFARTRNGASRFAGILISIFSSGMIIFAALSLRQISATLDAISVNETSSSQMVIAVRADDAAETIEDTANYKFGTFEQEGMTQVSTVVDELTSLFGSSPDTQSFDSPVEVANALLNKDIDALIYDGAYTNILDDVIENYSDQVKILNTLQVSVEETPATDETAKSDDTQDTKPLTERSFNVYISGIDVRGPISTTSRSDVNILMSVNPSTGQILLTTTPRDYYVTLPNISGEKRDKLTHAGIYGINASIATMENLYGINIDYYVRINFDSLINLVDVLGGVDVNSEYSFSHGRFSFSKGINHLNGQEALAFSRERYAFSSGDNQRGQNQMLVLTGIIEKLQSPAVLSNTGELLSVVQSSMQTNVAKDEITNFIAFQLAGGPSWKIDRQAVIGSGDNQETYSMPGTSLYVMWPDEDSVTKAAEVINKCLQGTN